MATPLWIIMAIAFSGIVGWVAYAIRRARHGVPVICPFDGKRAIVKLAPGRAAFSLFFDVRQKVVACDRWPDPSECGRLCEHRLGP